MELDELHVLHRYAGRIGHADAAAVIDEGVRGVEVYAAVAAGGKKGRLREDRDDRPLCLVDQDNAVAGPFLRREGDHHVFVVDLHALGNGPLVERVEEHVSGQVRRIAGPREAGPAEGTLGDRAVREPAEGTPPVLHLVDDVDRLLAHDLHRVLVGEVVAPLDRVERVLFPRVVPAVGVVAQGGVDAALGRDGVGPDGMHLGDEGDVVLVAEADRCPQPGQTASDNEHIVMDHAMLLWRRERSGPPI